MHVIPQSANTAFLKANMYHLDPYLHCTFYRVFKGLHAKGWIVERDQ